ncbi:TrfB-related DNA-binding protein [Aeromonas caviae]|uniref:TrfB-related DNA-binding protein n=1 Tax=Aeromonas caviae TaxID=648 RepID=UPI00403F2584
MVSVKKSMTEEQFSQAAQRTTLRPHTIAMAYDVVVRGMTQSLVAKNYSVSKGAVSQVVKQIWDAHIPPGFTFIAVSLPLSIGTKVEKLSQQTLINAEYFSALTTAEATALLHTLLDEVDPCSD